MKTYIHAAENINPFDVTNTDTSFYNNFLNPEGIKYMQDEKNLTGEIVMMSPYEYFQKCSESIFNGQENSSVADLKRQRELSHEKNGTSTIDQYKEDMLNGDKFPLCYLDYSDKGQEGLHRMYAAGAAFGWSKKFPVLVVKTFDEDRHKEAQRVREAGNFERYKFKDYVNEAVSELSDWDEPVPEDLHAFCELVKEYIIDRAKYTGYDIDVDVEIENPDDIEDARMLAYLTNYNGYDLPTARGYGEWLSNMFNIE